MSIEQKYIHNGALLTLDELHTAGVLPSTTQPTATTVYGLGTYSGQTATRYVGSEGDCMVVVDVDPYTIEQTGYLSADESTDDKVVGAGGYVQLHRNGNTIPYEKLDTDNQVGYHKVTQIRVEGVWVKAASNKYGVYPEEDNTLYFRNLQLVAKSLSAVKFIRQKQT